jgi:putative membrane protein
MRVISVHVAAAAIAGVAMIACSKSNNAATDSAAAMGPAPGTVAAVPGAAPGPDSAALPSSSATSSSGGETAMTDGNIVAKSMSGDSAEVAIGRYMESNTKNAAVRSYAALLVSDHGKGMKKVTDVESKQSITAQPPSNDTTAQETAHVLDHLRSLNGPDRDTAFVNHEIQDHQSDIADAKQMAAAAQNPQVKSMVQDEIPELQKHLDKAQALSNKLSKR